MAAHVTIAITACDPVIATLIATIAALRTPMAIIPVA